MYFNHIFVDVCIYYLVKVFINLLVLYNTKVLSTLNFNFTYLHNYPMVQPMYGNNYCPPFCQTQNVQQSCPQYPYRRYGQHPGYYLGVPPAPMVKQPLAYCSCPSATPDMQSLLSSSWNCFSSDDSVSLMNAHVFQVRLIKKSWSKLR